MKTTDKKAEKREKKAQLNLPVPETVKREFKAVAASLGVTMEQAGIDAIHEYLQRNARSFLAADSQSDSLLAA